MYNHIAIKAGSARNDILLEGREVDCSDSEVFLFLAYMVNFCSLLNYRLNGQKAARVSR